MAGQSGMRAQRIHPAAYGALSEALATIYWYKRDLATFIRRRAGGYPQLLAGLDFDGYKRAVADEFVDRLMADEDTYRDLTLELMLEVALLEDFPSLKRQPDAEKLLAQAWAAVASLKRWTQKHQGLVDEREALAEELAARRTAIQVQRGFAGKLTALEKQFLEPWFTSAATRSARSKRVSGYAGYRWRVFSTPRSAQAESWSGCAPTSKPKRTTAGAMRTRPRTGQTPAVWVFPRRSCCHSTMTR